MSRACSISPAAIAANSHPDARPHILVAVVSRCAAVLSLALVSSSLLAADGRIAVDLDGDGQPDRTRLDQTPGSVRVAVDSSALRATVRIEFEVDRGRQDAVCQFPVRLATERLDCNPDGVSLPGCKRHPETFQLVLDDGQCDAIRVYWDHDKRALNWWRR